MCLQPVKAGYHIYIRANVFALQTSQESLSRAINQNDTNSQRRGQQRQETKGLEKGGSTKYRVYATVQCLIKFSTRGFCQEWRHCLGASGKTWHASVHVVPLQTVVLQKETALVHLIGVKKEKKPKRRSLIINEHENVELVAFCWVETTEHDRWGDMRSVQWDTTGGGHTGRKHINIAFCRCSKR